MNTLEQQIHDLEQQLSELDPTNIMNEYEISRLKAEIERLKWQQGQQQAIEAKTEERVHQEISFNIQGVDFTDLPSEVIELVAEIVKFDRKKLLEEHGQEIMALHTAAKEAERATEERETQLRRLNEELQIKLTDEERKNVDLEFRLEKMTEARDNAASVIEEQKQEIERLNNLVDDYQKAKVFGERTAQTVIDVPAGSSDAQGMQELVNKISQRYKAAEDWGSIVKVELEDGSTKLVKRSELAEMEPIEGANIPKAILSTIEVPQIAVDTFREVDSSDVEQGADSQEVTFPEIKAPEVELHGVHEGAAPADSGEARTDVEALGAVSREEFEALKFQVRRIERYVYNEPHTAEDDELESRVRGA